MEQVAEAPAWAAALEATWLGATMRQSAYAYPAANLAHLLGLVLLVGPIMLLDLRLLGLGREQVRADVASGLLTPFSLAGLALFAATGPLLFMADARALSASGLMWAKLALLVAGLANAVLFRALWRGRLEGWDRAPPLIGRLQAAASIAIWLLVAGLGRMVAYL